jgi:hypothetical protein
MSAPRLADRLRCLHGLDDRTVESGRYVSITMLIDTGDERALVTIDGGRVTSIADAATVVMPSWGFALRAPAPEWEAFWAAKPRPGSHDLFALLRRKQLRIEGDLHPFMSNLLYFKALLALPRAA